MLEELSYIKDDIVFSSLASNRIKCKYSNGQRYVVNMASLKLDEFLVENRNDLAATSIFYIRI